MPIIDQLPTSTLSLLGNGFNPQSNQPAWGYSDATNDLNPATSKLQNTYSVNSIPNVRLKNFNRNGSNYGSGTTSNPSNSWSLFRRF